MGSHVLILAAMAMCLLSLRPPLLEKAALPGALTPLVLAAYLAGAMVLAWRTSLGALRSAVRQDLRQLHRHQRLTRLSQLYLLAGLGAVLSAGYSRWIVQSLGLWRVPLADEAVALAPFVAAMVAGWWIAYSHYRLMRLQIAQREQLAGRASPPPWSLGQYLDYNLRHHLLFVLVPVGLILLVSDVLELYVRPLLNESIREPVLLVGTMVAAGGVFLLAPLIIARIWRTSPLQAGPLRSGLKTMCRSLGVGARDILVWRTGRMIANAAVIGLVAPLRYVLISDMLLEQLDRRQVEAVFAHEAAHIAQHHILYSVLFAFASAILTAALAGLAGQWLGLPDDLTEVLAIALLVVAWAFGYGWISRRFERQADVWSAWVMGGDPQALAGKTITPEGAGLFAMSLQRIAQLSGLPLVQRNWRHGSVSTRVQYVLALGAAGASRTRIDRLVRWIKIGLWIVAAGAGAVLGWDF